MDTLLLFFIVLFAVSVVIIAAVVVNMRKIRREPEEEKQHNEREQEARRSAEEKEQHKTEGKRPKGEADSKHFEQETQEKGEEDASHQVEEERRRLADELQKTEQRDKRMKEEATRNAQEEERRKAEEQARERAKKEQPERVEKERRTLGQRRPPLNRGGRPRGSTKRSDIEQEHNTKPHFLKPELICWNEGWTWVIGIEVPEEFENPSVAQNGELLEQDSTNETRYRLKQAEGTAKVSWTGGEKDIPVVGAGRNYLILKMRKDWKGLGRLVRCYTAGYYLIIVPKEWKRDEEVSGSATIRPERANLNGYMAHFFYQEQNRNTVIGFITANGERIQVESGSPRFQLVGTEIDDASEEMGPLFGEEPPRIAALNEQAWNDVRVVIVGEEGSSRDRWRTPMVPQVGAREQKLPDEIANRRGGWFFVRIYDNDDSLLESMDFRFSIGLKNIRMESFDCLPGPKGHDNATIRFLHRTDCNVELVGEDTQHPLEIRRENGETIVTIPPKPDCDKSHWILRDGDAEIAVTILVERIWWAFGVMGVAPTDWVDKPITLSRKDFTAITDKALWVRLPRLRFVRKIDVGFGHTKSRPYQAEVEKKEITIPLRDFCDTKEIENRREQSRIMIWVQRGGAKTDETLMAELPVVLSVSLEQEQRKARKALTEEEPNLLYATVKCRRRKRRGKGFSRNEVTRAGITVEDVRRLHIPYDKRRKTLHSWNVQSLGYITER